MILSNKIKICFFVLLLAFINIPLGHSNSIYNPALTKHLGSAPPVEKGKPPVEKGKKKKKKKNRRYSTKKHLSNKKSLKKIKQESHGIIELAFGVIGLLIAIFIIIGAFVFGFGIHIAAAWITGAVLMGVANFLDLLILIVLFTTGMDGFYAKTFLWIVFFINFIIGLTFLLWGLLVTGPIAWIMGLVLLGLALLFLAIFLFTRLL